MERFADPVIHDERRYQASLEACARLDKAAQDYAEGLMERGQRYDPFSFGNLTDALAESPTFCERLGDLLRAGRFAEAGEMVRDCATEYVRPLAVELATDKIELGEL